MRTVRVVKSGSCLIEFDLLFAPCFIWYGGCVEQHSVPQHIASFEFKLFGNLTVRQFVTLAIPMSLAALIFFSGLPPLVRFILSGAIGLFGLFIALVPIGGRPFDKWVFSFIKAVLSPTQRVWIKEERLPEFLNVVVAPPAAVEIVPESITAQGRERLKNYLRSLPRGEVGPLDVKEQIAVERLGLAQEAATASGREAGRPPKTPILWPTGSLPQITRAAHVSMARMSAAETETTGYQGKMEESLPTIVAPINAVPRIADHAKPYALPGLEKKLRQVHRGETVQLVPRVKAQLASEANFTVESVIPIKTPDRQVKLIHGIGKTRARKLHFAPPEGFDLSKLPIRGERRFEISEELKRRFTFNPESLFGEEKQNIKVEPAPHASEAGKSGGETKIHKAQRAPKEAHFVPKPKITTTAASDVRLAPEEKEVLDSRISISGQPTQTSAMQADLNRAQIVPLTHVPNVMSGIVTTKDGEPVEKVILVVRDSHGIPVRALKTNKLGQFLSATPLPDGVYTVEVESELYHFAPFSINLTGQVVEPLEIKAES